MKAKVTLFNHSLHRMFVGFPIAFLTTSVVLDLLYFATKNAAYSQLATEVMAIGIALGFIASSVGWIDWWNIPKKTRAREVGLVHGWGIITTLSFFILSLLMRLDVFTGSGVIRYFFSFGGLALLGVSAWLGGELVERMGVGIQSGANENAPGSFSARRAAHIKPTSDKAA